MSNSKYVEQLTGDLDRLMNHKASEDQRFYHDSIKRGDSQLLNRVFAAVCHDLDFEGFTRQTRILGLYTTSEAANQSFEHVTESGNKHVCGKYGVSHHVREIPLNVTEIFGHYI